MKLSLILLMAVLLLGTPGSLESGERQRYLKGLPGGHTIGGPGHFRGYNYLSVYDVRTLGANYNYLSVSGIPGVGCISIFVKPTS